VFGLPETFFGDASTGSLATAKSLDRPTELKFLEAQERWRMVLGRICHYVLRASAGAPSGRIREALKAHEADAEPADKIQIHIDFPSVLEHDIAEEVSAIISAATLNGFSPAGTVDIKTLAHKLNSAIGYEKPDAIGDDLYPDAEYKKMLPKMFPVEQLDGTAPAQTGIDPGLSQDPSVIPQKPQQKGARGARPIMNQEHLIPRAVAELRNAVRALVESRKKK